MGLFTQKPQFDDDLPALPGEPLQPESAAERLADGAPVDAGGIGLLGEGGAVESIVIPVPPSIETTSSQESPSDD
ncbi:MAG TPA: hypothetical protein VFN24_02085 [Microbacterium sp.]|nr:hypothetical protein [Microbacterium sp.]